MAIQSAIHELKTLIRSYHPLIIVETPEERRFLSCVESACSQLKLPLYEWSIVQGLKSKRDFEALPKTQAAMELLVGIEKLRGDSVFVLKDFSAELADRSVLRKLREICQEFSHSRSSIILTGTDIELPDELQSKAVHIKLAYPSKKELGQVVKEVVTGLNRAGGLTIKIAQSDLNRLIESLSALTLNQARQIVTQSILESGGLRAETIDQILEAKVRLISDGGLLEYFPSSKTFADLGGFENLKRWLEKSKLGFSEEAKSLGLQAPRGLMLVGVPGCGKSLAAKYCAALWQMPLLKLDFSRIFDKYIGETEKNFFRAIEIAENLSPVVLWIDEIEKGIQSGAGDESGVSQRLLGSFLSWMQEKKESVFVMATANDFQSLPPELMRKGRFDEIFFVDLPSKEERRTIFSIHLKSRKQDLGSLDLDQLVLASEAFTGAEIEQAVVASLYESLHQKKALTTEMLMRELRETKPLSHSRREEIEQLRNFAENRFVSVGLKPT